MLLLSRLGSVRKFQAFSLPAMTGDTVSLLRGSADIEDYDNHRYTDNDLDVATHEGLYSRRSLSPCLVSQYLSRIHPTLDIFLSCCTQIRLGNGKRDHLSVSTAYRTIAMTTSAHLTPADSDRNYLAAATRTSQDTGPRGGSPRRQRSKHAPIHSRLLDSATRGKTQTTRPPTPFDRQP